MVNRCSLESAQRSYDNRMPADNDEPEMDCPECGESVDLEDTGLYYNVKLTGTCERCGTECEYDNDQF